MKKTKIICTMGPSTDNLDTLIRMIQAGMDVARFNFSHGTHCEHAARIELVRSAANRCGRNISLMLDTKGPEMRLGKFDTGKVRLHSGQRFSLVSQTILGNLSQATVNYSDLYKEVENGTIILLSDGLVGLRVISAGEGEIVTEVLNGGEISDNKRVAVPGIETNLPSLSENDVEDIKFGCQMKLDFIAASFVRRDTDVLAIRSTLEAEKVYMRIIAKIENRQGVDNIDRILKVADGIMVARGDLGVEIPYEEIPSVQKNLIRACNEAGKPVITATQMLESMVANPRPTRAEASDVSNAIIDGTDAIMLSGETAAGKYPVEAVAAMAKIAVRTEVDRGNQPFYQNQLFNGNTTEAVCLATSQMAFQLQADAVIVPTETGFSPRMVAKYRPAAPIIAVTPYLETARGLMLSRGVQAVLHNADKAADVLTEAVVAVQQAGFIKNGDLVIVTSGAPYGTQGTTNSLRIHTVGKILLTATGIGANVCTGQAFIARTKDDVKNLSAGEILIIKSMTEELAAYAHKAGAIVCEESGLTSVAAVLGVTYDMPVIVGAADALETLDGEKILTVDASRGIIYKGEIQVR